MQNARPLEFVMGDLHGARLLLRFLGRDRAGATGDEPLVAEVEIAAGGFSGRFRAFYLAAEFAAFRNQLATLYESLSGSAVFESVEGGLRIEIEGNGRGALVSRCDACDDPAIGNRLHFLVLLDQSYIPNMIESLDAILGQAPAIV